METSYLSPNDFTAFYKLHFPNEDQSFYAERSSALVNRFETKERSPEDYILLQRDGCALWSFLIFEDGEGSFGIQTPKHLADVVIAAQDWNPSMNLMKERLQELKAKTTLLRFTADKITNHLPEALGSIGFKKNSDRIEFKTMLKDLPSEMGTPIAWKAIGQDGLTIEFAAEMMSKCSKVDPNWDNSIVPLESIKTDLEDSELYNKPDSIHIGFVNEKPVAFVFAQVNPENGWSRLTYLGIVPEMRGQGLGKWVQRHGFEMMRQQGGIEYHGGTVGNNASMLKTFRSHGCKEYRRVEEWILRS